MKKLRQLQFFALCITLGSACGEVTPVPPVSLDAPTRFAAIEDLCFSATEGAEHLIALADCSTSNLKGSLVFVVNEQSDRVAMVQTATANPSFIDADFSIPGVSHLNVGRLPVDIAVGQKNKIIFVLNQLDRNISMIDTSGLQKGKMPVVLEDTIAVDGIPIAIETLPETLIVAYDAPSKLDVFSLTTTCEGDVCTVKVEEKKTLQLPGTISDLKVGKTERSILAAYRDLNYISQINPEGPCGRTGAGPCIEHNISASYACSDGLDNDGDGKIDAEDPQCFGPLGGESKHSVRDAAGECNDGIDNDADGLADREDPDCVLSNDNEDKSVFTGLPKTQVPKTQVPKTQCNDGIDNDGDGKIDFAEDKSCYGPFGKTESDIPHRGVDALAIGPLGKFAYLMDRVENEVKVIMLEKGGHLIDAPQSSLPAFDAFTQKLGIGVTASPTSIEAVVFRRVEKDRISYAFGAWVSADNSFLQFVDTVQVQCSLKNSTLKTGYISKLEGEDLNCIANLSQLPLPSLAQRTDDNIPKVCLEEGADLEYCQRAFEYENRTVIVNPRFSLVDIDGKPGRAIGNRVCEQPAEIVKAMEEFAASHPKAPQLFKCDSPLMPQPIALDFTESGALAKDISSFDRATILKRKVILGENKVSEFTFDQRLRNENWKVKYEGIIPGSSRKDGVLSKIVKENMDERGMISSNFNPCTTGIELGDRVKILSKSTCVDLKSEVEDFLSYEITAINASSISFKVIDDGNKFAKTLATRSCFDTAVEFEIRPTDEWTVVGDESGMLSSNKSVFGECISVNREGHRGRVKTGGVFKGPYLSFELYPGFGGQDAIQPLRDLSFSFTIDRNFESLRYETNGYYPSNIQILVNANPTTSYLIATDIESNFVYFKDFNKPSEEYFKLY